jgi:hypothetical protein
MMISSIGRCLYLCIFSLLQILLISRSLLRLPFDSLNLDHYIIRQLIDVLTDALINLSRDPSM